MKLTAEREPLLEALTRACRVAPRRNTIPILGHVHLEATKSRLVVTATDLDRELEISIDASVSKPGIVTASAETLRGFVGATRDGEQVELDGTAKADHLVVRAGRARVTLPTLPEADFPEFKTLDDPATFTFEGQALADALGTVLYAQSNESTRYYLNGVFFRRLEARLLALVATDGHRLGLAKLALDKDLPDFGAVIVPREAVGALHDLAMDGVPIECEVAETMISFTRERTTIASKLIDGTFPDYERVIPPDQPKHFECRREELARAAKRCAALADNDKSGRCIALTASSRTGALQISSKGSAGEIVDELEADAASAVETPLGVNARYLADALDALTGAQVRLHYADAGSPIRITDPADDQALHVLMPMRIPA